MQILVCSTWHTVHRLDASLSYREPLRAAKARPPGPLDKATHTRTPNLITGIGVRTYDPQENPPAANLVVLPRGEAVCLGDFGFMYYETGDARDVSMVTVAVPLIPFVDHDKMTPVHDALEDFVTWLTQERWERTGPDTKTRVILGQGKGLALDVPRKVHLQKPEKPKGKKAPPPLVLDTTPTAGVFALDLDALAVLDVLALRLGL